MNARTLLASLALGMGVAACSEHATTAATETSRTPPTSVAEAPPSPAVADDDAEELAPEKFTDGAKAFAKVRETLLQSYVAEGLTEDDLYRAATAGMIERLDPKMKKWNRLLTPREIAELKNDLKGEVIGIGVNLKFDPASGHAEVLAVLPTSPAEKAGILAGDRVVTVNGKLYKGMRTKDVLSDIRGKAGETVTLSVLRADKLLSVPVVRDRVAYDQTIHRLLPDAVGYVRIPSFNDKTPTVVRDALDELKRTGAKSLVVDLRQCPGGSFDRAVETAELLLPKGAGIVSLQRKGKPEEKLVAKGTAVLADVPLAVLVDGVTASGCEFVAAALAEGRHARLVGAKTTGKWTVQSIEELPNGYAAKYTVGIFKTPSGKSYQGTGLAPDVVVTMTDAEVARATATTNLEQRIAIDPALRTAKQLVLR